MQRKLSSFSWIAHNLLDRLHIPLHLAFFSLIFQFLKFATSSIEDLWGNLGNLRHSVEMDYAWVFARNPNEPEWLRQQQPAKEVKKLKKLKVKVVMCCNTCVEKVEDAVRGMHGVFDFKTDRWKDLLTIELTPGGGLDHGKLVRKLKRATHDRKVEILDSNSSGEEDNKSTTTTTTTVEYRNPYFGPGYNGGLVPWPASSSSSSNPPFITNPFYLHHPVGCGNCIGYPGAVCANCGRGSELGARFL